MSSCFEFILRRPCALEDRRVDRLQHEIILWACKVQEPESIYVTLVLGRECDLFQSSVRLPQARRDVSWKCLWGKYEPDVPST